jgi:hypothetical protein
MWTRKIKHKVGEMCRKKKNGEVGEHEREQFIRRGRRMWRRKK